MKLESRDPISLQYPFTGGDDQTTSIIIIMQNRRAKALRAVEKNSVWAGPLNTHSLESSDMFRRSQSQFANRTWKQEPFLRVFQWVYFLIPHPISLQYPFTGNNDQTTFIIIMQDRSAIALRGVEKTIIWAERIHNLLMCSASPIN